MKALIISDNIEIESTLERGIDDLTFYYINNENIFENGMIVLEKYASAVKQMFYGDGVFINTIFSFLRKLKLEGHSLYYRQLHTKLLERTKNFLIENREYKIMVYQGDIDVIEYLDVECISYKLYHNIDELIYDIKHM